MFEKTMRKLRLYLDTSVISGIDAPHKPEAEAITRTFFRAVDKRSDEFELLISPVVVAEIENCPEPKLTRLLEFMARLPFIRLVETREVMDLARAYVADGVLGPQHIRDLTHIAYAVVARCDSIVSWNFEHFVNVRTIQRVNQVNSANHYGNTLIVSPQAIIGEKYHEND